MPLTSVTADRVPCRAGDSTEIVAPGIDKPSFDVMVPVMTPDWMPCAAAGGTAADAQACHEGGGPRETGQHALHRLILQTKRSQPPTQARGNAVG